MESTQNKIYEIEESALIDQNLKNVVDDDLIEENKNGNLLNSILQMMIYIMTSLTKIPAGERFLQWAKINYRIHHPFPRMEFQ